MGHFLKGLQQQFILSIKDTEYVLEKILNESCSLFLAYADNEKEKQPLVTKNALNDIRNKKGAYHFFIVDKNLESDVVWTKISLENGGTRFSLDPLNSKALQLLLSIQNEKRISVGRISVCTLWKNEKGENIKTIFERKLYNKLKKIIYESCVGSIYSKVWVGKNAYELWINEIVKIAYDLNNPDEYSLKDYEKF